MCDQARPKNVGSYDTLCVQTDIILTLVRLLVLLYELLINAQP